MKKVAVGEICNLINGKAFKPEDWSEKGHPIIRIQNLNDTKKPFNFWSGSLDRQVEVKAGDVLLAWSGTPGTSFGVHIWNRGNGILNQHIFRVDIDHSCITADWFKYAVNDRLHELIAQAHGGVGLQHVTRPMVERLQIPLPPLDEQKRIAAILDKADALRRKRRQALALLDSLTQSIFLEMFGATNCAADKVSLDDVCSVIRDGTHSTPKYVEAGIPFVTVKNISGGSLSFEGAKYVTHDTHMELTKRVKPQRGDILVSKDGSIGIPCIVDTDSEFSIFVSVALLKPIKERINSVFLSAQLGAEAVQRQIREYSKGVAIRHLHLADFKRLQIILPRIELQDQFAVRIGNIQRKMGIAKASCEQFDSLFASLQHRAFTGQL